MTVWDICVARSVVSTHAKCGSARETAKKLRLQYEEVLRFLDWLWAHQKQIENPVKSGRKLARPTVTQYLTYLYEHDASLDDVVDAVQWPRHRVWQTVGTEYEWRKSKNRARLAARASEPEYQVGDPTPEQLAAELETIRGKWTEGVRAAQEKTGPYTIPTGVDLGLVNFD